MRLAACLSALLIWAAPLWAEEKVDRLARALQLDQVMEILVDEGQDQRRELDDSLLDNSGGSFFEAQVGDIFNPVWMKKQVTDALETNLTEGQLDQAILFFESDLGQTIVSLENSARRAISDDAIEEMARDIFNSAPRESTLFRLVDEYIQVNDLIERNVQGSLSADYSFFRGLDRRGVRDDTTLLAELLAQQDSLTEETETWLFSFLLLAYSPLEEAQMRQNIAFSRTEAGRALNKALFDGFDRMFDDISYRLGEAVAQVLNGSDL